MQFEFGPPRTAPPRHAGMRMRGAALESATTRRDYGRAQIQLHFPWEWNQLASRYCGGANTHIHTHTEHKLARPDRGARTHAPHGGSNRGGFPNINSPGKKIKNHAVTWTKLQENRFWRQKTQKYRENLKIDFSPKLAQNFTSTNQNMSRNFRGKNSLQGFFSFVFVKKIPLFKIKEDKISENPSEPFLKMPTTHPKKSPPKIGPIHKV